MAGGRIAFQRQHTDSFNNDQIQQVGQRAASKVNDILDVLDVLNNRAYVALAVDATATAAYVALVQATLVSKRVTGFLIITLSASGTKTSSSGTVFFQVVVDGVVAKGIYSTVAAGYQFDISMVLRVPVKKGTHVVQLQWKTNTVGETISAKSINEEHVNMLVQEAA